MPLIATLVERVVRRHTLREGDRWYVEDPTCPAEGTMYLTYEGSAAAAATELQRWRAVDVCKDFLHLLRYLDEHGLLSPAKSAQQ